MVGVRFWRNGLGEEKWDTTHTLRQYAMCVEITYKNSYVLIKHSNSPPPSEVLHGGKFLLDFVSVTFECFHHNLSQSQSITSSMLCVLEQSNTSSSFKLSPSFKHFSSKVIKYYIVMSLLDLFMQKKKLNLLLVILTQSNYVTPKEIQKKIHNLIYLIY